MILSRLRSKRSISGKLRPAKAPPPTKDATSITLKSVLMGGGSFDVSGEHPNQKGWDIFEKGQKAFWAVPEAVDWDAPVKESPEYSEAIADMLTFLCPGEKAAVTGATLISSQVSSEEAKFYFALQAVEEAKHYDGMRLMIPKLTGKPLEPPSFLLRLLYSFGVIDKEDTAFMMGSINIIGEHLAHAILHKIRLVATDPQLKTLLTLIAKDESRHIGAGRKFFPEVYPQFQKNHRRIMAKNLATALVLGAAGANMVKPMDRLELDLSEVMEGMYKHYADVTGGFPAFLDQALMDTLLGILRKATPVVIRSIREITDDGGDVDPGRLIVACERALTSPRYLRRMLFAA